MKSDLPKVLHKLAGRPLLDHVLDTATGADVEIEDRGSAEVVAFGGTQVAPVGTIALNPAFDVTPAALVTAIVTDRRTVRPARGERP